MDLEQNDWEQLTKKECLGIMKSMDSGKSPGRDGLPAEFY